MYAIIRYKIDDFDTDYDLEVVYLTMDEDEAIEQLSHQVFFDFGCDPKMKDLAEGRYRWEMPADRDDFIAYAIQIQEI